MKKIFKDIFIVLVIFLLSTNVEAKFSDNVNSFGWDYCRTLDKTKNIFYSPYSICVALSIVANGASDETQKEILSALAVDSAEDLNSNFKNFNEFMQKNYTDDIFLKDANLMLVNKKFSAKGINSKFEDTLKNIYKSEVRVADFENDLNGEKKKITSWIAKNTNNFIPNYEASPTADTVVNLFNVIYFKGSWEYPFEKRDTRTRTFTNVDNTKSQVPMLFQIFEDSVSYYEDEKYKAISLPYKKNLSAMYLILPKDNKNLNVVEDWNSESLDYQENFLRNLNGNFNGEVYVRLPKLDFNIKNEIVGNLRSIGISRAFTNDAEFFNIVNDTSLKIDKVFHQAKLQLDEEGTEAAAVTEIVMLEATAMPFDRQKRKVFFYAERPFLLVIRDIESETNLFVGAVNKL